MALFTETTQKNGQIVRFYERSDVFVVYTLNDDTVTVKLLHSLNPGKGNARLAFTNFCHTYKHKKIVVKVTNELNADLTKLNDFYVSLGFVKDSADKTLYVREAQSGK